MQRLPHRPELLDRADALGAAGGVRGAAADPQAERQRPGVGRDDVEARSARGSRTRRPASPARSSANVPSPPSSSPCTDGEHARRRAAAPRPRASPRTAPSAATSPAFMSQAPRPCRRPSRTLAANGVVGPRVGVADRDDVDVPVQHQRRAVARAREPTDQTPRLRADRPPSPGSRASPASASRSSASGRPRGRCRRTGAPARLRVVLGIGAAHARDAHEVADLGDHRPHRPVDMIEHVGDDVAHRSLPRAATIPASVRQVWPKAEPMGQNRTEGSGFVPSVRSDPNGRVATRRIVLAVLVGLAFTRRDRLRLGVLRSVWLTFVRVLRCVFRLSVGLVRILAVGDVGVPHGVV